MCRSLFSLAQVCVCFGLLSPMFADAQSPPEPPIDRLSTVEQRLEALERENAETQGRKRAIPAVDGVYDGGTSRHGRRSEL